MEENIIEKIMWWVISLTIFILIGYGLIKYNVIDSDLIQLESIISTFNFTILSQKLISTVILFFIFGIISKISEAILLSKFIKSKIQSESYLSFIKLMRVIWWFIYCIVILSIFVENFASIITSLGLIGFGLTFALQKPILNFIGWLTINFKSIYKVGERIEIGNIRGDVKEIAIMNTVLEGVMAEGNAKEFKTITFPNEIVLSSEVTNFTKDSNYILDKLVITITYESDYNKAVKVLEEIIIKVIKENKKNYQKYIKIKTKEIEDLIKDSTNLLKSTLKRKEEIRIEKTIQDHKTQLENEQKKMEVLEEEFAPKIRIELNDSSIAIEAFYLVPYTSVKKTRTDINLAFLNKIAKMSSIEIAYPHMEIVYSKDKVKPKSK